MRRDEETAAVQADGGERPSWRQRVRSGTIQEIKRSAREVLTADGQNGLTIRAVARQMGLSSPSIYRYFASHGELVGAVIVDLLDELVDYIKADVGEAGHADPAQGIRTAARALRRWALAHPNEFDLTMTTPVDLAGADGSVEQARWRFAAVFADLFGLLWQRGGFPRPGTAAPAELPPGLVAAAETVRARLELPLPVQAVAAFLRGWVRLYGVVCMEAMGQLRLVGDDTGAVFECELAELGGVLGL
jgi:AcrR family transcriptional regulator